jgi:hypothetical protein
MFRAQQLTVFFVHFTSFFNKININANVKPEDEWDFI